MPSRVLGVLAGADMPPLLLHKWAASADILIAADGGADQLLAAGLTPNYIVGDLDSITPEGLRCGAELYQDVDETYTDADKLLKFASSSKLYPLTLVGVEGDRLDHVFGSIHSVVLYSIRSEVTIALRRGLAWVLGPGSHSVKVPAKRCVSIIPLIRCKGVGTEGLRWPLEHATLEAGLLTSISNFTTQSDINVKMESGLALLVAEFLEEEFPRW